MGQMRAVTFSAVGEVSYTWREIPKIQSPDDVLLKILAASICGSDLGITAVPPKHPAKPGVILGHECVAEVVELGAPSSVFQVGDHVLLNPMIPCMECTDCKLGRINTCKHVLSVGETCDGVFAEYYVAQKNLLYPINRHVEIEQAVFAEPLACVMNGFQRLHFLPGQSVLILGAGPIGLLFSRLAKAAGASHVLMTETAPFRIEFARKQSAASRIIDCKTENIQKALIEVTGQEGADVVIDTVGTQIQCAIASAAIGGQILLFGINATATETINQCDANWKELTIVATLGTLYTFPLVVKLLESGSIDLSGLLTHRLPLSETAKGLEMLRSGESMKVVLYP